MDFRCLIVARVAAPATRVIRIEVCIGRQRHQSAARDTDAVGCGAARNILLFYVATVTISGAVNAFGGSSSGCVCDPS